MLTKARPEMRVVVPAARSVAEEVLAQTADWPGAPIVIDPRAGTPETAAARKRAAFKAANVSLAASGTVSLELAAAATPMVIAYRMQWLSYRIIRTMALIDTVTLVNIVSDTRVVPEFLGPACQPAPISRALEHVLAHPQEQIAAMALTMDRLGQGGEAPGMRAARAVLERM